MAEPALRGGAGDSASDFTLQVPGQGRLDGGGDSLTIAPGTETGTVLVCTATASDTDGGTDTGTAEATVTNTDPVVESVTVTPATGKVGDGKLFYMGGTGGGKPWAPVPFLVGGSRRVCGMGASDRAARGRQSSECGAACAAAGTALG